MFKRSIITTERQPSLFPPQIRTSPIGSRERGAVFTRNETVEFILDLAGYTSDKQLHHTRLLEPSFGNGDFLLEAVKRLLTSYARHRLEGSCAVDDLADTIRAVEIDSASIDRTGIKLRQILVKAGITSTDTERLVSAWIVKGDFLLVELSGQFSFAMGNPPYVRQELIPDDVMTEYRARYETIYDRADLYIPFLERCLKLLKPSGSLGVICSDRWMKNRYGGPLRALIAREYHLKYYVDMVETPAFQSEVSAYPAITIITREKAGPTRIAHRPAIDRKALLTLSGSLTAKSIAIGGDISEASHVVNGAEPWILHSFDQLTLVRRLEESLPTLEESGCKVGIGVATGADKAFIAPYELLDVEPDRKLPLVTTSDIKNGDIIWQGLGVINPFHDNGSLVELSEYPKFARYVLLHREVMSKRHCVRTSPAKWFKTIDRINPLLTGTPKLLIPDIKGDALIVYDEGRFYPHHNLYYITSEEWDLHALQSVLRSGIAKLFVAIYSVRMRGGYLRFQAQYLRRIRLPRWSDVSPELRTVLSKAAAAGDPEACNRATFELYQLTEQEKSTIGGNGR